MSVLKKPFTAIAAAIALCATSLGALADEPRYNQVSLRAEVSQEVAHDLMHVTLFSEGQAADPAKLADWGLDNPAFKLTVSVDGGGDTVIEAGHPATPDAAGAAYVRLGSKPNVIYKLSKANFEDGRYDLSCPTKDCDHTHAW